MPVTDAITYTVAIFTYNPNEQIFKRCLAAIAALHTQTLDVEFLLVDNNSQIPVADLSYVQEYLQKIPAVRTISVKEQGLKYARIAAVEQARGDYMVFFDYDNEPEGGYLLELAALNQTYPQVKAWGPGNVWVDFTGGVDSNIEAYAKTAFQERHENAVAYAAIAEWQSCYPYGSGLCIAVRVMKEYIELANKGVLTLLGRKGEVLSSGEDTQMVLLCIRNGYAVGVSPGLKLHHIIPATRANVSYLRRLTYATSSCYESCMVQVFSERKKLLEERILTPRKFVKKTIKQLVKAKLQGGADRMFKLVYFIGLNAGVYIALDKPLPNMIKRILRYLKIA